MKSKRSKTKVTVPVIHTRAEAEHVFNLIAQYKLTESAIKADVDSQIIKIKEQYSTPLQKCEEEIAQMNQTLLNWAQAHPEEFNGKKSIQFPNGTIGFRTAPPKLELANRKWTWNGVLQRLIELGLAPFIRTKEEVDKEAILARYSSEGLLDGDLTNMGVKVVQDESFFVDPDLTSIESRKTQPTTIN